MNVQKWLAPAEIFDSWRIVPRIIIFLYMYWAGKLTLNMVTWYEKIPSVERTREVTAFVTVVLPGVFALATWVYKIYAAGGRSWDQSKGADMPTRVQSTVSVNK